MWDKVIMFIALAYFAYGHTNATSAYVKLKMYYYYILLFFAYCMLIIIWPYLFLNPKRTENAKICSRYMKYMASWTDLKWELRNGDILAENRSAVIVSNHQSLLDILGMFIVWDIADKVVVIAKKVLFYIWPIGPTLHLSGVVFIDRKQPMDSYRELINIAGKTSKNNTKIFIFPEGTRNTDTSKLLPFKKGAFTAAIMSQIPIVPVVFSPYHFFNKGKENILRQGPIIIQCLEPVPTEGLTIGDVPDLMERVRDAMAATHKQLSKEVLNYSMTDSEFFKRPVLTIEN